MDIQLVDLVIVVAVLVVTIEFNLEHLNRQIDNWRISVRNMQYVLNNIEVEQKEVDELNKQEEYIKGLHKRMKIVTYIRQFLPISLTIEVLHIALQFFGWSCFYEWILPGLNKVFLTAMIVIALIFFTTRATLGDKKILEYQFHNWETMMIFPLKKAGFK